MNDFRNDGSEYLNGLDTRIQLGYSERIAIRTGWDSFDEAIRGLHNGKLYVVGGRPGSGKTSFASSLATGVLGANLLTPVLYFSTELETWEIFDQMTEARAGGTALFPNGRVCKEHEKERLRNAGSWLKDQMAMRRIFCAHERRFTVEEIHRMTVEFIDGWHHEEPGVVIVDQASRISRDDASGRRSYSLATENMLNAFESMTKEVQVPVVLLTQANRDATKSSRPMMSHLKHSGAFEEYAHMVTMLEHDEEDNLWVDKNRHGRTGKINAHFQGEAHTWIIPDC